MTTKALQAMIRPGSVQASCLAVKPAPTRPSKADLGGYRSKLERSYACYLAQLQVAGDVIAFAYEPQTFVCAGGTRYTPDFAVWWRDRGVEIIEVKGFFWSRDRVRVREAAPAIGWPLVIVTRDRHGWNYERR